jgi:porin
MISDAMRTTIVDKFTLAIAISCQAACGAIALADDAITRDPIFTRAPSLRVQPVYTGEVFSNTRGGISTNGATRYLGLMNLGLTLEGSDLSTSLPGKFYLLTQNTHGQGLTTEFVGDTQVVSNIDAYRNIMQVSEYWWECSSEDEFVVLRIGKQDFNTEFMAMDTTSPFVQSSFGLSPSTAFPTFPNQSMGAVLILQLAESWRWKSGLWDAFSQGGTWGFSGNSSIVVAGELEYTYALDGGQLPGILSVGAVYESSETVDAKSVPAVYEYVLQWEQTLYKEEGLDPLNQGLSLFAGVYPRFAGEAALEDSIGNSLVAGLVYSGLLPGRDRDCLGIGVAWAELYRGGTNEETVTELFYRIQLAERLTLQPDFQYVASPSGIYPDAFVIGTRSQITW